ncbi:MAG: hypothetical protein KY055_01750, partial [Candidatus Nealsonbacteria bacterium]|nr:hypothetical protein [Candidatus Nealsonbacteria bacterium]
MASKIKKRKKIIKKPAQPSRQSGLKSFTSRASAKGRKERLLSLPERHSEGAEMKANPEGGKLHRLPERHSEGAEMKANPEGGKLHRLPERHSEGA